jgi:hypothetical protein
MAKKDSLPAGEIPCFIPESEQHKWPDRGTEDSIPVFIPDAEYLERIKSDRIAGEKGEAARVEDRKKRKAGKGK